MVGQLDPIRNEVVGEVPCGFCDGAEEGWALHPSHLQRRWYDNPDWFAGWLGQHIRKIVAVGKTDGESPEPIADIQLAEQDMQSGRSVMHVLEKPGKDLPDLLDSLRWGLEHSGFVNIHGQSADKTQTDGWKPGCGLGGVFTDIP